MIVHRCGRCGRPCRRYAQAVECFESHQRPRVFWGLTGEDFRACWERRVAEAVADRRAERPRPARLTPSADFTRQVLTGLTVQLLDCPVPPGMVGLVEAHAPVLAAGFAQQLAALRR